MLRAELSITVGASSDSRVHRSGNEHASTATGGNVVKRRSVQHHRLPTIEQLRIYVSEIDARM